MAPAPASAGAWVASDEAEEIWTSAAGERGEGRVLESSLYLEVPVLDHTSVVAAPWLEQNWDTLDGWRGEATLGVKREVFHRGDVVMALQGGAWWSSHPPLGCSEGGAEIRWLAGRSFGDAFVNLETAGRALQGGCSGSRVDLTLGYQPTAGWLGMGQVFYDAPAAGEETVRLQVTLVRRAESGRGLQLGLRGRIDGGPPEPALVIGFWGRPGD